MPKYKVTVPAWEIEVSAKNSKEAEELASNEYDDQMTDMLTEPCDWIVEKIK